jgi:CDP-diacylglycerol--glycerol-3-phosphate 3-phosphatidyltransferase
MAKPLITANQVTLLRLVLLPVGGALMYGGTTGLWAALVFMTLLGCTDFIDGWLARRYGSTELGRLMDPLADKVFVVVIFMPFIDLGWLTGWQVGLLLSREFVVTALRSTYERRHIPPRTAFLAKVKAWAQMAGCGVLFMLRVVPRDAMLVLIILGAALPVLATLVRYFITGYIWRVSFIFAGWFGVLLLPYLLFGSEVTFQFLAATVIGITWLSAWGYIAPVLRMVVQGKFDASDWVRLIGSIALPVLLILAQVRPDLPAWVIIVTMCLEMAVGGLDNLLCVHGAESTALAWGLRVGLVCLFTGLALHFSGPAYSPLVGTGLLLCACVVALVGTAMAFYRGRRYYLEEPKERTRLTGDD